MSTDNKLSTFIETQVPDFLLEEGPVLVQFLEAYYEWMEQSNNVVSGIQNILSYRDIDQTLADYIEFIKDELFADLPTELMANKRLLAKHIRNLYSTKGSEKSYKLLFRILYNEDIDFAYPGENILRASDGVWIKEKILRVENISDPDSIFEFTEQPITGQASGATAVVENVKKISLSGLDIYELSVSSVVGEFIDQELVTAPDGTSATVRGVMNEVTFVDGGAFHQLNDTVTISAAGRKPASATITELDHRSAIQFTLLAGGSGYRANATITFTGGSGTGASFSINGISNTETVQLNTDQVGSMANVELNTGPQFQSGGEIDDVNYTIGTPLKEANVSSTLVSSLTFANVTTGTISSITLVDPGFDYNDSVPTVSIVDEPVFNERIVDPNGGFKGGNAVVDVQYANGAIEAIQISNIQSGLGYNLGDAVDITNSRSGTFSTTGTVTGKGGTYEKEGRWGSTRGWLSSDMVLEDNFFYQEFSYVIKVGKSLEDYRNIVSKILHPAGTIMFGEVVIDDKLVSTQTVSSEKKLIISDVSTMIAATPSGFIGYANVADENPALQSYISASVADYRFVTVDDLVNRKLLVDTDLNFIEGGDTIELIRLGNTAANVVSTVRAVSSDIAISINDSAPFTGNAEVYRVAPVVANTHSDIYTKQSGTVAFSAGSKTLTGTGTTFTSLSANQALLIINTEYEAYRVASISNNTILTLNIAANTSNSGMDWYA